MGFFEVSPTVRRRFRLHAELEQATAGHTPDGFDDLDTALHTLPDVDTLTAEQTVAALMAAQAHRNRVDALLTELAGPAEAIGAATTLRAGSTGKTTKRKHGFRTRLRPGKKYRAKVRAVVPGRGPVTTKRFRAR